MSVPKGPSFATADEAAIAAIQAIVKESIKQRKEFAGRIFRFPNGRFGFTKARPGLRDDSDPGPKVAGMTNVGTYHTHGGEFEETDEVFSPKDKLKATLGKEVSYLGTPYQRILKYTPVDLLPAGEQQDDSTGRVDVLVSAYTIREVTIVGDPKGGN